MNFLVRAIELLICRFISGVCWLMVGEVVTEIAFCHTLVMHGHIAYCTCPNMV